MAGNFNSFCVDALALVNYPNLLLQAENLEGLQNC